METFADHAKFALFADNTAYINELAEMVYKNKWTGFPWQSFVPLMSRITRDDVYQCFVQAMMISTSFLKLNMETMRPYLTKRTVSAVLHLLKTNGDVVTEQGKLVQAARILERVVLRFIGFKKLDETSEYFRRDDTVAATVDLAARVVSMKYLSSFNTAFKKGRWRIAWKRAFSHQFKCLSPRLREMTERLSDI